MPHTSVTPSWQICSQGSQLPLGLRHHTVRKPKLAQVEETWRDPETKWRERKCKKEREEGREGGKGDGGEIEKERVLTITQLLHFPWITPAPTTVCLHQPKSPQARSTQLGPFWIHDTEIPGVKKCFDSNYLFCDNSNETFCFYHLNLPA